MKNYIEIYSEPFYLRPLLESDLYEIHAIWTDAHVRKYLFDDILISLETALLEIKNSLLNFQKYHCGLWAVYRKKSRQMIGFAGFRHFHQPPELQLLYGLLPQYWGKGYATKLAKLMLKYAFEELKFDSVIASADAPNAASIRVMEKAGMKFMKRVTKNGLDTIYHKLEKRHYKKDDTSLKSSHS
jgi:ribosomal-protein-alanine N-acetyltransferase